MTHVFSGKVVLYQATSQQRASAARRADRYDLEVVTASVAEELREQLDSSKRSILLLYSFTSEVRATIKALRALRGWKKLPIFVLLEDEAIDARTMKQANDLNIEVLPTSLPEGRRWQKLREANEAARSGSRWAVDNRRAHFRLPLKVKVKLHNDAETVDISVGGLAFLTNQQFHCGDVGSVDIRSLLGDMDEPQRALPFEVVSVKQLTGNYRHLVGARWKALSSEALRRLKDALELIEPTTDEH